MTKTMQASEFDFTTGDLEDFLRNVQGLNLSYRSRMLRALKAEHNEMVLLGEVFAEANNREVDEGIRLMDPAFRQGFLTLFLMNGGSIGQLSS
jgi:hypothetical protein